MDIHVIKTKLWARIREHQASGGTVRNQAMADARGGASGGYFNHQNKDYEHGNCLCILGLYNGEEYAAAEALDITYDDARVLEAGFEGWGRKGSEDLERRFATDEEIRADPFYQLGAEITRVLDEEERAPSAATKPSM